MIPRIFHWVWLGRNPLPQQCLEWMKTWIRYNPGWMVMYWTNSNLFKLENRAIFDSCGCLAGMCDTLRLEIVLRYGGVYLDVDFECIASADRLTDRDLLIVREHPNLLDTNVLGAERDHPFIQHTVDMLPQVYEENRDPDRSISHATSLAVVNKCRATWKPTVPVLEDRRVLFPFSVCPPRKTVFAETIGIHHSTRSWFYQEAGVRMPTFKAA